MNRTGRPWGVDRAAVRAMQASLGAIRCAATLLVSGTERERDRGIGVAILSAVNVAETALRRLDGPTRRLPPAPPGPHLN